MAAVLSTAQIGIHAPGAAAELSPDRQITGQAVGGFAGLRLRVPLALDKPRASLVVASTLRNHQGGSLRVSPGVDLGLTKGEQLSINIGGRSFSALAPSKTRAGERKLGLSTTGWIAIGVGIALAVGGAYLVLDEIAGCRDDNDPNCGG